MKKVITIIPVFLFGAIASNAQITIYPYDIALAGKVLYQANDTTHDKVMGGLNPGPSGANKTWDFSTAVNADLTDTLYITNPAWLSHASSFPTSNLAVLFPSGTEYYLKNNATGLYAVGAYGDLTGQGASTVQMTPGEEFTSFPNTYNSSFQNTSTVDLKVPFVQTGIDSARFKEIKTKNVLTDGWGTVKTPLGSYPSIRQRGKVVTHDSIWVHYKSPVNLWSYITETMDSAWHFEWWASGVGFSLMSFDSTAGDTIRTIQWLKTLPAAGSVHENAAFKGLNVFPNPSAGMFFVSVPNTVSAATAEIYNALGKRIFTSALTEGKAGVNISSQPDGIYYLKIRSAEGTITRKIVVNR